ncbi:cell division topological specificity factor MinE [Buchnera aphidicola]|uniref:cell division topological specificity factor MinE n=1 Tax=Buchnera aphidicola TaxID=9 RepID=UPI0031B895A8
MSFLYFFYSNHKKTANIAKKRLNYIISKKKRNSFKINCLKNLKNDILTAVKKNLKTDINICKIKMNEKKNKSFYIIELNINFLEKK